MVTKSASIDSLATESEASRKSILSPLEIFSAAYQRFKAERQIQKTIAELNALDDRSLADIGLLRSEIEKFARGGSH